MTLTEEQKQEICSRISDVLEHTPLLHHCIEGDENEPLPLVDLLSTGDTVKEGQEEIENIVSSIYFDMDNW